MTAPIFVDTNVLIYALDKADVQKHHAAQSWRTELWKTRRGRISYQVLQEFYVNVTQKWPAARDQAQLKYGIFSLGGPCPSTPVWSSWHGKSRTVTICPFGIP